MVKEGFVKSHIAGRAKMRYSIQRGAFMSDTFQYTVTLPQSVKRYLPDPEQEWTGINLRIS
jgi:hypothetical protein